MTPENPSTAPLPLVVSIGDPLGIGPEIALQAWLAQSESSARRLPPFVLLCDPDHLSIQAKALGLDVELHECLEHQDIATAAFENFSSKLPVVRLKNRFSGSPGVPSGENSQGIVEAISTGVDMIRSRFAAGLVTLPINKKSLYNSGFDFPGHTEFLGSLSAQWPGAKEGARPVMMLAGPQLRAIPVTIHIPLSEVPGALTSEDIVETVTIAARDLTDRFDIASPRVAISGLNPHAGENGAMGKEDETIIAPAISTLQKAGINCFGPLPADTMFHAAAREKYDVAVCMYHDQALIPAKALAFEETVNVTLGLPFIRTSPDHGTAYDLAGKGTANPASFVAALTMADQMSRAETGTIS